MSAALRARVRVQRGGFTLDAALAASDGEVLAVIGPNGSGKSTLLRTIAGLIWPDAGEVVVDGTVLTRAAPARSGAPGDAVLVPPTRRGVGLLGQDPLLFPHLSALQNVEFGPLSQGVPRGQARRDALAWLEAMQLRHLARRKPGALSGGQQQRVAIARALAARPAVLLLDEPMAALDVEAAPLVRELLADRIAATGTTTVVVTHDVQDVLALADRVLVLEAGRVVDDGPVARVLGEPNSSFADRIAAGGLLSGTVTADGAVQLDVAERMAPGSRVWLTVVGERRDGEGRAGERRAGECRAGERRAGGHPDGDRAEAPGRAIR